MIRPRWRKLWQDVRSERGRIAIMVTAIAVSLMGIGAVLGAYAILMREMPRNYLSSRPASAALELGSDVEPALLDAVRRRPGIAAENPAGPEPMMSMRVVWTVMAIPSDSLLA